MSMSCRICIVWVFARMIYIVIPVVVGDGLVEDGKNRFGGEYDHGVGFLMQNVEL